MACVLAAAGKNIATFDWAKLSAPGAAAITSDCVAKPTKADALGYLRCASGLAKKFEEQKIEPRRTRRKAEPQQIGNAALIVGLFVVQSLDENIALAFANSSASLVRIVQSLLHRKTLRFKAKTLAHQTNSERYVRAAITDARTMKLFSYGRSVELPQARPGGTQ
jgi:hypothetical protein